MQTDRGTGTEEFPTQKPNGVNRETLANMANGFLAEIGEAIIPIDKLIGIAANFCTAIDYAQKNKSVVNYQRLGQELAAYVVGNEDHNVFAYETIARLWVSLILADKIELEQAHQTALDFYRNKSEPIQADPGHLKQKAAINGHAKVDVPKPKTIVTETADGIRTRFETPTEKSPPASIGFRAVLQAAIADHEAKAKSLREFLGKIGPADDSALSEIFKNFLKGE